MDRQMPEGWVTACSVNVSLQSLSAKSCRTVTVREEMGTFQPGKFFPLQKCREGERISPCSAEPSVHTSGAHGCILGLGSSHALVQTQQHPEQRAWENQNKIKTFPFQAHPWCGAHRRGHHRALSPFSHTRSSDRTAPQLTCDSRLMTKGIPWGNLFPRAVSERSQASVVFFFSSNQHSPGWHSERCTGLPGTPWVKL